MGQLFEYLNNIRTFETQWIWIILFWPNYWKFWAIQIFVATPVQRRLLIEHWKVTSSSKNLICKNWIYGQTTVYHFTSFVKSPIVEYCFTWIPFCNICQNGMKLAKGEIHLFAPFYLLTLNEVFSVNIEFSLLNQKPRMQVFCNFKLKLRMNWNSELVVNCEFF